MKRTAVTLGIAIAALVAPGAASATGVIQHGFGSSPGSVRPLSGIVQNGIGTSPGSVRPLTGVIVTGISTSPGSLRPGTGIIVQGFGTSPHSGVIANRFTLRLLAQMGVLQQ